MQITFNRAKFATAFITAASAAPARTPKDILKNVYMEVTTSGVELVATDQEVGIRQVVEDATTTDVGEVLLPTAKLGSILRETTDETIDMSVNDQSISVKSGTAKFRLVSGDPNEFPPVPGFSDKDYYKVAAPVFRQMIRRTLFATDVDSTRYALGGLLVEFENNTVTVVSTDSRRLAVCTAACESNGTPYVAEKKTVVPSKAMQMLERSIDPREEFVDIAVHDNHILMRSGNTTVYSRLVEGRFPRYRDVIPKSSNVVVPIVVGPFFSAVRQSQIVTDEENRGVQFEFKAGELTIRSNAAVGESSINLPIEYDSEEIQITFDPKYMADALKVLGPEVVIDMALTDADTAAVIREGNSFTYVIMPLAKDR